MNNIQKTNKFPYFHGEISAVDPDLQGTKVNDPSGSGYGFTRLLSINSEVIQLSTMIAWEEINILHDW